jgi:ppGpp synthetase/RelA/SpoT-type nucleotidyltranferase
MAWAKPQYTKNEVNKAGKCLVMGASDEKELSQAIDIVDNFRAAHAFPLNTLQHNLREHAKLIDSESIVAQRLKRLSSTELKLWRFHKMELWDMQDIGGCRAIVYCVGDVEKLVDAYKSSRIRHKLVHEDDYIKCPRTSGYRSWHLVYRYFSDRNNVYNGLKIEIQIRTALQHSWATAVETVDAFTEQALKSSRGRSDWERFFQLMGTEMAERESTAPVPSTPTDRDELHGELKQCADELKVIARLKGFQNALRSTKGTPVEGSEYFLLSLDTNEEKLTISGYDRRNLVQASEDYAKKEKEIRGQTGNDAVLVSVDSIMNLQRAYPNYFANTDMFIEILEDTIGKQS